MYSEIRVSDRAGMASIDIEGVIGVPEKMQFDRPEGRVATYAKFSEALKEIAVIKAAEVIVNIRSTGGDVNDAMLIYEALRALDASITTRCYGYVASAATIIAQAASAGKREVSSSGLYLIHCSESATEGNSDMILRTAELLDKTDERIAGIYAARSGRDLPEFVTLMKENSGKGRWLSAEETVSAGLADKIIEHAAVTCSKNEDALAFTLKAVAHMLGITSFPGEEYGREAGRGLIVRLCAGIGYFLDKLYGRRGDATARQHCERRMRAKPSLENKPSDKTEAILLFREAQSAARRTRTMPCEDPAVGEVRRSPNEQAYYEDSLSLRGSRS